MLKLHRGWRIDRRAAPRHELVLAARRRYGRLVDEWGALIGLDLAGCGIHSLRRTKVALISRRIGNLRAWQLLLGHTKLESTMS